MTEFETTKMGERGQIVVPQLLRNSLDIHKGDKFIVFERGDMLIFKKLKAPNKKEINDMFEKAQALAKKHNLKEKDIWVAIKKARSK